MTARIATAAPTMTQIVPFGRRSISTPAIANPAAMSTLAARIELVRDRLPLTAAVSSEQGQERCGHSCGVRSVRRRR